MAAGIQELVSNAKSQITLYSADQARGLHGRGDTVFVDVRDEPELRTSGRIPGAVHASRGMLEFHIDPKSPYHNPAFHPGKEFVFYCKSGGRSALAAQRAREMGLEKVASLEGGFPAWEKAAGPVERE